MRARTAILVLVLVGCAGEDPSALPAVDAWPSPNPDLGLAEREARIAGALTAHPPLVDEVEFVDGRTVLAAIGIESEESVEVWVAGKRGIEHRYIAPTEIAAIRRAAPEVALERRLTRLARVEAEVDAGLHAKPKTEEGPRSAAAAARTKLRDPVTQLWEFDAVDTLADLPGAGDVRWWPAQPSRGATSAWEPTDPAFDRTGLWTLSATGLGHDAHVVLQVQIDAERVVFTHSPGYWGADAAQLHSHWRLVVDDRVRWEYTAGPDVTMNSAGRYPYDTAAVTMGPGEHVVRWELRGCDSDATYFWGIDAIRWERVTAPRYMPTWGAFDG